MNKKLLLGITLITVPVFTLMGFVYHQFGSEGIIFILSVLGILLLSSLFGLGLHLLIEFFEEKRKNKMFTETAKKAIKK